MNPADLASRGVAAGDEAALQIWSRGPEFLQRDRTDWPQTTAHTLDLDNDPEVKKAPVAAMAVVIPAGVEVLIKHFSSLQKLCTAAAWWLRIKVYLRARARSTRDNAFCAPLSLATITVPELRLAQTGLIAYVQRACFQDDVERLEAGVHVKSQESFKALEPVTTEWFTCCRRTLDCVAAVKNGKAPNHPSKQASSY